MQLILLAEPRRAPQIEQLAFAGERLLDVGVVDGGRKLLGHRDRLGAVALGGKPRLARIELGETLGDDRQIRLRHGFVEANENIAGLDPVAVAHANLADDTAARVLDLLDVGIDDQRALGDQRAGDLGGRGPAAESDAEERYQRATDDDMPADRRAGIQGRLAAHPMPPCSGTTFKVRGGALGWVTRLRISSFGPNCC